MAHPGSAVRDDGRALLLAELAEHLTGELRLRPLLERVLAAALELLGCRDGSIGLLDAGGSTYRKEVELGVVCDVGRSFPVAEGMTGAVLRARAPVVVDDYAAVPGGHLHPVDRARLRAAVGVPVLPGGGSRAPALGALVVFSDDPGRRFSDADADLLALFARHAAIAITTARLHAALAERDRASAASREREAAASRAVEEVGHHLTRALALLERSGGSADGAGGGATAAVRRALSACRAAGAAGAPGGPPAREPLERALRAEAEWGQQVLGVPVALVVAGPRHEPDPEVGDHLVRALRVAVLRLGTARAGGASDLLGAGDLLGDGDDARAADGADAADGGPAAAGTRGGRGLRVGLVHGAGGVSLLVEDDGGSGAEPDADLVELVRTTRRLGGAGEVTATPGWGTRLRLHLPHRLSEAPPPTTGVLVVDDRPALRAGLAALLEAAGGAVRVVGEVARADEAVAAAALLRPHLVLLGRAAGADAAAVERALRGAQPATPVLALAALPDDVGAAELAAALGRAAGGPAAPVAGGVHPSAEAGDPRLTTPREREVLVLLERGWSDRQIAAELVIARKTVEKHVGALLRKHGVHNRTALVAARRG